MGLVVLAMSGGVDSSVAARLLLEAGEQVVGVFMRHGESADNCARGDSQEPLPVISSPQLSHKQGCCTASDAEDARRVAAALGIPFYALNLRAEFRRVMDYFVDEYSRGRTPNPCVMCNHWIKFGHLFDYADSIGADCVATGHYARIARQSDGSCELLRGRDDEKDQAYVLFGIRRELLPRVLLPVGAFSKAEIRRMAREVGLRVAAKRDSQEICFVEAGRHPEFVAARSGLDTSGEIVDGAGTVLGRHPGIEHFTIGQRRGLGVAMGKPAYVIRIEPDQRRVVIGPRSDLARRRLRANRANWLIEPPTEKFEGLVQIRYNSSPQAALIQPIDANCFHVEFMEPCHGVAPGQAAVCFMGDRLLGGGWIESDIEFQPSESSQHAV